MQKKKEKNGPLLENRRKTDGFFGRPKNKLTFASPPSHTPPNTDELIILSPTHTLSLSLSLSLLLPISLLLSPLSPPPPPRPLYHQAGTTTTE